MFFSRVEEQDQYHQTIRNLVVIIGSLFSDMVLVRKNHKSNEIEEKILVPINFANRDKMLALVREAPSVESKSTSYSLPRIGFSTWISSAANVSIRGKSVSIRGHTAQTVGKVDVHRLCRVHQ